MKLLVAALLLTACSPGVQRARPPAGLAPAAPLTAPAPEGLILKEPAPWQAATDADPWAIDVHWTTGVPSCGRLAAVEVAEDRDAVTIRLVYGSVPLPERHACVALGISARTRVELRGPLAGRRLVDGARPDEPHTFHTVSR